MSRVWEIDVKDLVMLYKLPPDVIEVVGFAMFQKYGLDKEYEIHDPEAVEMVTRIYSYINDYKELEKREW